MNQQPAIRAVLHGGSHLLPHRDDLGSGELSNNRLEDLVDDRGQNLLVVIGAKLAVAEVRSADPSVSISLASSRSMRLERDDVHGREILNVRPRQDTARNVDHLQILRTRKRGDVPGGQRRVLPSKSVMASFAVRQSLSIEVRT